MMPPSSAISLVGSLYPNLIVQTPHHRFHRAYAGYKPD
jgi:hypothetical protein